MRRRRVRGRRVTVASFDIFSLLLADHGFDNRPQRANGRRGLLGAPSFLFFSSSVHQLVFLLSLPLHPESFSYIAPCFESQQTTKTKKTRVLPPCCSFSFVFAFFSFVCRSKSLSFSFGLKNAHTHSFHVFTHSISPWLLCLLAPFFHTHTHTKGHHPC